MATMSPLRRRMIEDMTIRAQLQKVIEFIGVERIVDAGRHSALRPPIIEPR